LIDLDQELSMETETLKQLIKESIIEVIQEERLSLIQLLIPTVSEEEMREIKEKFGSPDHISDWLNDET
jgi:hypothetical protein